MGFFRQKKKKSSRAKGKARSSESGVTQAPVPPERPQVPAEPATELRVSAPRKSASPKARIVALSKSAHTARRAACAQRAAPSDDAG